MGNGSGVKRQQWGTLQRLTSDDLSDIGNLSGRALVESLWAMSFGDAYRAVAAGVGGVLGGYLVEAIAGTNTVRVSPGIALVPGTPADSSVDSPMVWVQADEPKELDLAALVDNANPRLVTIELSVDVDHVYVSGQRNKLDPNTGEYLIESYDLVVGGLPQYHATAGVASATPVVAAGTPGRIPLAIVKLVAGQAGFLNSHVSILMCRPLLGALGHRLVPRDYVRGGGLSVGEESGGSVSSTTFVTVHSCNCSLLGLDADPAGFVNFPTHGRTKDGTVPATLISAVQPVYAYAAPPPWANDYGAVAPREAWHRNPNAIDTSQEQSIVGGKGNTFMSLLAETAKTQGRARRNSIVLWDTAAPVGIDIGLADNAPVRVVDARGSHPDTALGGSITINAVNDPTWGPSQVVTETVYLGCLSSIGSADFVAQSYRGAGEVVMIDEMDVLAGTGRRPLMVATTTTVSASIYPGKFPAMQVGDDAVVPAWGEILLGAFWTTGSDAGNATVFVGDKFGFGAGDPATPIEGWYFQMDTTNTGPFTSATPEVRISPSADGSCTFACASPGANFRVTMWLRGWVDPFLASR